MPPLIPNQGNSWDRHDDSDEEWHPLADRREGIFNGLLDEILQNIDGDLPFDPEEAEALFEPENFIDDEEEANEDGQTDSEEEEAMLVENQRFSIKL